MWVNAYDKSTCSGNSDYENFKYNNENITLNDIF